MTPPVHVVLLGAANSVHLQRWAQALHARGRRISVVSQHVAAALPLPDGVALHSLPLAHGAGYLLNVVALRRMLARLQPDLLHAHYASGYGTLARLAGYVPTLLSVWGSDVYEFPERGPFHHWLLRGNLRAAQALASTSAAMASRVQQLLGEPVRSIALTPFGVDTARFQPAPDPAIAPAVLTIGTVKTLAPAYGIDLLLQAYARLCRARPDLRSRLRLVGDGPQRPDLQALARRLGLAESVDFVGEVPHARVPAALQALDIYAAPSRQESFGVAVVEAMACGRPVVVSDAGGLPEVVGAQDNGVVVPAGDVAALAAALERLALDPALRRRMGEAARARVLQAYDWDGCVGRMVACQDAVIAAHPKP